MAVGRGGGRGGASGGVVAVRLVAAVVAGMAAVAAVRLVAASWRCVWWRGRSPHMILLYQVRHGTRNIARICRVSNRAKSPKIG